jgi:hypothetical protein
MKHPWKLWVSLRTVAAVSNGREGGGFAQGQPNVNFPWAKGRLPEGRLTIEREESKRAKEQEPCRKLLARFEAVIQAQFQGLACLLSALTPSSAANETPLEGGLELVNACGSVGCE